MKTKAALISLGCDKNTVDSEIMLGLLANNNFEFTADLNLAEIIIINTCGFLQDALDESLEEVANAAHLKQEGACRALIVTGCAAVRFKQQFLDNPAVDAVLGVDEYEKLPEIITKGEPPAQSLEMQRIPSTPKHYAYLRIAEGCDTHCSYCTIPKIRGPFRSRPMDALLAEAARLAELGVKELILVAQNTTLYGKDLGGEQTLHILLKTLSEIDGIKWIRLLYCYPEHIYDAMLAEMAENTKVLPYLDMPIQHASDNILKLMNRKSTANMLRATIAKIRGFMPDITLRTTLITGFPGETKSEFKFLCDFLNEIKFDRLGVFPYSREEGTAADKLPGHLPEKTKIDRHAKLMQLQQRISANKLAQKDGQIFEVVVEGFEDGEGVYFGRSHGEAPDIDGLIFISSESKTLNIGDFVKVKIIETWEYDMMGEYLSNHE